jgi:hypothetical protein
MEDAHTTQHEIAFVDRIKADVKTLGGYIAGAKKRTHWDRIDRTLVMQYAARLILIAQSEGRAS